MCSVTHSAWSQAGLPEQAAPSEAAGEAAAEGEQHMALEEAAIHAFLLEAFAAGTEGLMLKVLDGPKSGYAPSKRSESWLKIKKCARPPSQPAHLQAGAADC